MNVALWNDYANLFARTAMHSIWQGGAIALVAGLLVALMGDRPRMVYATYLGALLLMAACLPVTWGYFSQDNVMLNVGESLIVDGSTAPATTRGLAPISFEGIENARGTHSSTALLQNSPASQRGWMTNAGSYILGTYLVGFCTMILRLGLGVRGGKNLRASSAPVGEPLVLSALNRAARDLGIRVRPPIAFSSQLLAPVVVGIVKPVILLPASICAGVSCVAIAAGSKMTGFTIPTTTGARN